MPSQRTHSYVFFGVVVAALLVCAAGDNANDVDVRHNYGDSDSGGAAAGDGVGAFPLYGPVPTTGVTFATSDAALQGSPKVLFFWKF